MPGPHRRIQDIIKNTLVLILAGGEGQRLHPLTRDRAKPAVPFGGHYRIIDFTLSNCLNSGLRRIYVLIQYKSLSLDRHIRTGWNIFSRELGEFIDVIPPQQRTTSGFYKGTADAIFQNIYTLEREKPEYVLILSGDHVYKMDYGEMLRFHVQNGADLTIASIAVPRAQAKAFGVVETDERMRIRRFVEKPQDPAPMPGRPDMSLVSMGIYAFKTDVLVRQVCEDARKETEHDFGKNIIPSMVGSNGAVYAYPFKEPFAAEGVEPYWRDIGTIDSYFAANMDLVAVTPRFNLYDKSWPIRTYQEQRPPAKFVFAEPGGRMGAAVNSIVAAGCIISGGWIENSVLSPGVHVHSHSRVSNSILMEDVDVGRHAEVRFAIIDKGVKIPPGEKIGVDLERDRKRFTVSPGGVVVVPKEMLLSGSECTTLSEDSDG